MLYRDTPGHDRHAPAVDHRSRRRAPADAQRGRHACSVVFNGEIYNFRELRAELEARGPPLPHALRHRGHRPRLRGVGRRRASRASTACSAFALWDARTRTLVLARDRFGEKPLYYSRTRRRGCCSRSELKSLLQVPGFTPRHLRRGRARLRLLRLRRRRRGSIFEGVRKLPAGHFLRFVDGRLSIRRYYTLEFEPKLDARRGARRRRSSRGCSTRR